MIGLVNGVVSSMEWLKYRGYHSESLPAPGWENLPRPYTSRRRPWPLWHHIDFDAILKSSYKYSRGRQFVIDSGSFDFKKSHVYKTHDFAPETLPAHVRPIFMFGDPMNAAVSAAGFGEQHYMHIKSPHFANRHKIFEEDVLLLEPHFDSWMRNQNFEFASVRYENLYDADVVAGLSKFLELELKLPNQTKRATDWRTHEKQDSMRMCYASIALKVQEAPALRSGAQ